MTVSVPYRFKRSAAAAVAARVQGGNSPISAMIEIADRCNEACVHCYQVQGQKGELSTEQWEQALEELAELGVLFLTISGGEPTLRKDFLHLVRYARRLRFAVKIYSNGLNITSELAAELGALTVQEVQISLYAAQRELHDRVTRVPGSYDRVLGATRSLRAAGVRVVLKTPLMRDNAGEVSDYIALVESLGADYAFDPHLNAREDGDMAPRELAIDRETYLKVRRDPRLKSRGSPPERSLGDRPCGACGNNVHIEANGELRPCTQWTVPTGDALGGIADAWANNSSSRAIRGLTWNSLPGCRVCDLVNYCKRCFADAAQEVGDALMPYPSACATARWQYELRHGVAPEVVASPGTAMAGAEVSMGPYRLVAEHRLEVVPFERDAGDEERRAEHPWLSGAVPPGSVAGAIDQVGVSRVRAQQNATGAGPLLQLRRRSERALTRSEPAPSQQKPESLALIDHELGGACEVGAGSSR